ncbi:hypothetical protein SBV1_2120002 [Verrucomicrobia bacterium]|nr:hypothetical protein SBV1_2120002 [Verrucomicrobiota bacterium]
MATPSVVGVTEESSGCHYNVERRQRYGVRCHSHSATAQRRHRIHAAAANAAIRFGCKSSREVAAARN